MDTSNAFSVSAVLLNSLIPVMKIASESSDTSNSILAYLTARRRRRRYILEHSSSRRKPSKVTDYATIVKTCPGDILFHSHFLMSKSAFNILMETVGPKLIKMTEVGKNPVDPFIAMLLTLWTLANQDTFREIADRFGVARGGSHGIFIRTCKALYELSNEFIKWPSESDIKHKISDFNNLRGIDSFPNVVGALGRCHIEIPAPKVDPVSYYNHKGVHSMNLQAVCDSKMLFTDIFFGWPGSSHEASVWKQSPLGEALANGDIILPENAHIVGDSSYMLHTYLMCPYPDFGHLTQKQQNYNLRLNSSRVIIKQAFGRLKRKFRRLQYLNMTTIPLIKYVVIAACTLHNFIIENPSDCDHDGDLSDNDSDDFDDDLTQIRDFEARSKRDIIADNKIMLITCN